MDRVNRAGVKSPTLITKPLVDTSLRVRTIRRRRQHFGLRRPLSRRAHVLLGSVSFVLVFSLWCILSYGKLVKPYFLPAPGEVVRATINLFRQYNLMADIKASFYRVSVAFLITTVAAVPIGILMGTFKVFQALTEPLNDFIRYMPVPAFIPLTILWIGIGNPAQMALIVIGTFFQLTIMVADVVSHVPDEFLEVSYTLGYRSMGALWKVILPASLPGIFDALRVAVGWAWSYLILAEVIAADVGLGHMIMDSQRYLKTANVIAGIIIIGCIGLVTDLVLRFIHRRLFGWNVKEGNH